MKLYLVRHAVAYEHGDPAYPDDDQRPLTPKGARQFARAARGLLELIAPPAAILTSPLPRAAQTAQILHDASAVASPIVTCAALRPGGSFHQILADCEALIAAASPETGGEHNTVRRRGLALVGHNPSIGLLAAWLQHGDNAPYAIELEKGGAAYLRFARSLGPAEGELRWLVTPRILRRLTD